MASGTKPPKFFPFSKFLSRDLVYFFVRDVRFISNITVESGGMLFMYRRADKSLDPTRKETSSEVCQGRARFQQDRDASCYQEFFLEGKVPKEIHAILTESLDCFLPGRAKDLSTPL